MIQIYPVIAQFATEAFMKYHLKILKSLTEVAKSGKSYKGPALLSLGKLAITLDKNTFPRDYLSLLIKITISDIESSKSVHFQDDLLVIADICMNYGEVLDEATDIIDLINKVFRYGLSRDLIVTLGRLSKI